MVTLSLKEQTSAGMGSDLLSRSVCLLVSLRKLGSHRTVKRSKISRTQPQNEALPLEDAIHGLVQVDADPEMLRVQKALFKSPEYDAICRTDRKITKYLQTRCLPSLLKQGAYLLPIPLIEEVDKALATFGAERKGLVRILSERFPDIVRESEKPLGELFNLSDYPSAKELDRVFDMTVRYITFTVPENLKEASASIFQRERSKAQVIWAEATEEVRQVLRAGLSEFVDRMINGLNPRTDGKKKNVRTTLLDQITDFLGTFAARNITNDDELTQLVDQARKLLAGVDAKTLSTDQELRTSIQKGFNEMKQTLDSIVSDKPVRRFFLFEEEEV
jgi:hypothetical protein